MMRGQELVECVSALLFGVSTQAPDDRGRARMALSAILFESAFGTRRGREIAHSNQQPHRYRPQVFSKAFLHTATARYEQPNLGRCQSKILNTWSGHRTAQIDPEKCRKINDREIRF
jgi:hypothetical protein